MASSTTLPLLAGKISLSDALDDENDILEQLSYPAKRSNFYDDLVTHSDDIKDIVSRHLGVSGASCQVPAVDEWIHGSFNVCIPVYVNEKKKAIIRFPLPYKVGESTYPGNAEEKIRCEVATYAWIQTNCPSVPIPTLWGFGLPGGPSFTLLSQAPLFSRLGWYIRSFISWLRGKPARSRYAARSLGQKLTSGYLLLDYVEDGRMLSETWDAGSDDQTRRTRLFGSLARVILELAKVPQPRIGSLTIDNKGVITLSNRPLKRQLHQLENLGISTDIPRDKTYISSDTYLLDLLACHDSRVRDHPNSLIDEDDGHSLLSALTIMRALVPQFTDRERRHGPFSLMLTDLHPSNIFVDDDWNLKSLIDLEWACSQPIEMLRFPHWLSGRSMVEVTDEALLTYNERYEEFLTILEAEQSSSGAETDTETETELETETVVEKKTPSENGIPIGEIMRAGWDSGNVWYFNALETFSGLYNIFIQHVQPEYGDEAVGSWKDLQQSTWPYWAPGSRQFIAGKVQQKHQYLDQIRRAFEKKDEDDDTETETETETEDESESDFGN
ncbi:hypothetical protein B0J13DRAFT_171481 [Dactylonectria estremocensis]|uniref:Aminoglycoside phosphotransferase domain-containing protein n=1 Tax=Dactylonectria estremocensis TaxID=1079267 RepID=A0A9P9JGW2_9HYPO|nr:hypothetical protein B0J13DRAFT_171481 [Dactylonectria estremocensis]